MTEKIRNNAKGFGIIELLVIVVVVGLLGFGAWYVWNSKKSADKPPAPSTAQQTEDPAYKGWKTYSNSSPAFSFKYPSDWILSTEQGENTYQHIRISSADYKTAETELCTDLVSGYQIEVTLNSKFADPEVVSKKLQPDPDEGPSLVKDAKPSKLGDLTAVRYAGSPGECGYFEATSAYHEGYDIWVGGVQDEPLGEYEEIYNKLVKSFKF